MTAADDAVSEHVPPPPPLTDFGVPVAIITKVGWWAYDIRIREGIGESMYPITVWGGLDRAKRRAARELGHWSGNGGTIEVQGAREAKQKRAALLADIARLEYELEITDEPPPRGYQIDGEYIPVPRRPDPGRCP